MAIKTEKIGSSIYIEMKPLRAWRILLYVLAAAGSGYVLYCQLTSIVRYINSHPAHFSFGKSNEYFLFIAAMFILCVCLYLIFGSTRFAVTTSKLTLEKKILGLTVHHREFESQRVQRLRLVEDTYGMMQGLSGIFLNLLLGGGDRSIQFDYAGIEIVFARFCSFSDCLDCLSEMDAVYKFDTDIPNTQSSTLNL
jgi:hypothetical protein